MVNVRNVIAMLLVIDRTTLGQTPINCERRTKDLFPDNIRAVIKCGKFGEPGMSIVCVIVIIQHINLQVWHIIKMRNKLSVFNTK